MNKSSRSALLAAIVSIASTSAFAALPQSGLWAFNAESNGKPGRGIQIDRQSGSRIVISYFGYRADGSALFLQAGGNIADDGKTFSSDLSEYKNGRAVGGEARSGELAKVIGTVKIEFDTATSARITLPGETQQTISRISFNEHRNRLNNQFATTMVNLTDSGYSTSSSLQTFKLNGDQVEFDLRIYGSTTPCAFKGVLTASGESFESTGLFSCTFSSDKAQGYYKLENVTVDALGVLSGTLYTGQKQDYQGAEVRKLFGICSTSSDAHILGVPGAGSRCAPEQLAQ